MRQRTGSWRVYDARWEGQSYVLSLRQAFSQEIRRDGLEAVIGGSRLPRALPVGSPEERETAAGAACAHAPR
jgi:phospholipid transport system substrate-binding protein